MLLRLPRAVFITQEAGKLFLIIKQRIRGACSKVLVAPVSLRILGNGLEGLSHPASILQTGVYVLQPSQDDSHLLPSLKSPENDTDEEPL